MAIRLLYRTSSRFYRAGTLPPTDPRRAPPNPPDLRPALLIRRLRDRRDHQAADL